MTEFTTWRSLVDGEIISTIPDSVVSRPNDLDASNSRDEEDWGMVIETKSLWPSIAGRISDLTVGATISRIYEYDEINDSLGQEINNTDISALSAGDIFEHNDVSLSANQQFVITIDAEGLEFDLGRNQDATDYPYTSDDVDFVGFYNGIGQEKQTNQAVGINDVGNPDGVLND